MRLKSLIFILILFGTSGFQAQQDIIVSHERNSQDNSYTFFCENKTKATYTVTVRFSVLQNLNGFSGNEAEYTVTPGRRRLFKLTRVNNVATPNFKYNYSWTLGKKNPKIKDMRYLIPIGDGKETKILKLVYLGEKYGSQNAPKDYYALGFQMEPGDTVFAARKGIVIKAEDHHEMSQEKKFDFKRDANYLYIEHDDGTIGNYKLFRKDGIIVDIGQVVFAGDPLGIIGAEDFKMGSHMRFNVMYRKDNPIYKKGEKTGDKYHWAYVQVEFDQGGKKQKLMPGQVYQSKHTESLVTQEMSKSQIKKRKKKKL